MQYGPKRISHFSTILLNKNDTKKQTSRSFSILFSVMRSLEIAFQNISFVCSGLSGIVKNIDQMHKSTFSF